jgi:hypothetical protein
MSRTVLGTTGLAILVLGGLFGLVVAEAYLGSWAVAGLWIGYALLVVVALLALAGPETGCQSACAVVLLAFVSWLPAASAATQLPLALHGRTVDAVVAAVDHTVVDRAQRYRAELRLPDGTPVPGPALTDSTPRLHPGDTVRVVYDPDGSVPPRRPADVHPVQDAGWSLALAAALLAVVGWAGLRGRRRR